MHRFRNFLPIVAALVGAAILGAPSRAHADFEITVYEGSTAVLTVTQTSANNLTASTPGSITAVFSDGNVTFSLFGAESKPLTGNNPSLAAEDISISGTFKTNVTLTVDVSDTDFQPPSNPSGPGTLTATLSGNSGTPNNSLTNVFFNGYLANSNKEYGGVPNPVPGTPGASTISVATTLANPNASASGIAVAPYSMSSQSSFTNTGGNNVGFSFDNRLTFSTPAPAGLLLALMGTPLLGLGAWIRRRRLQAAA